MPARQQLTATDREEISRGIAEQVQGKTIAARIGRCPSVVSRDIRRHGGRLLYRATLAGTTAAGSRRRLKTRKLDANPVL
ncbi:Helix-turn-helix domain-containing protein, partial [Modestobacter sp. DSM 44400]